MYFSKAFKQIDPLVFEFEIYTTKRCRFSKKKFCCWGRGVIYLKVNIPIFKTFYKINFDIVKKISGYF